MKLAHILLAFIFVTTISSCNKTAGEGGTSSVEGKVYVYNLNASGDTISEYYAMDQDVFIIYGESNVTYNDKFATSYEGSYVFNNLNLGKYTVFAYSKCDACPSGQEVVSRTIEITEKKQLITVDDLVIYE